MPAIHPEVLVRALFKKDRQYPSGRTDSSVLSIPSAYRKGQKRRYVSLSMYDPLFLEARERNVP